MIANLSMYARPETATAIADLWALTRKNLRVVGVDAPLVLSQDADLMSVWTNPALVLSQTCGMPYRKFLHDKVQLVGTPHFDLPDCPAGHYFSVFVVRKDDPRQRLTDFDTARFAYNEENSQSGFAAPFNHVAPQGITFGDRIQSGGHTKSAELIALNRADIASIDAVTWELIKRYDAFSADLRVLERTKPTTPALPFITSLTHDPVVIRNALASALNRLPEEHKRALFLRGLVQISATDYLNIPDPA
jgi:ABC-type phosphate/phosphonate transport system substrate-binding protein